MLLIDASGKVKVSDFGVSRLLTGKTTLFTQAFGTLCWMSIESLQGEVVKVKMSSDVQVSKPFKSFQYCYQHCNVCCTFPSARLCHKNLSGIYTRLFTVSPSLFRLGRLVQDAFVDKFAYCTTAYNWINY